MPERTCTRSIHWCKNRFDCASRHDGTGRVANWSLRLAAALEVPFAVMKSALASLRFDRKGSCITRINVESQYRAIRRFLCRDFQATP